MTAFDWMPIPGRKSQHSFGEQQAVIADLDGDDSLEVVVAMNSAYLACFDLGSVIEPELGWPQQFPDVPMTPAIADLDGNGKLEMVVADRSGTVHVLRLPGASAQAELPWPQFGHDARNTSNYETSTSGKGRSRPLLDDESVVAGIRLRLGPSIVQDALGISFSLSKPQGVEVRILDVQGRMVRTLVAGDLSSGEHTIYWDGHGDEGDQVVSGVYFVCLKRGQETEIRRVAVIQ